MRIAFVLTSFPTLSMTAVLDQITGLLDRGHDIDIYADRPGRLDRVHEDIARYHLLDRTHAPRMPRNVLWRGLKGCGLLCARIPSQPRAVLRALNVFRYRQLSYGFVLPYAMAPLREPQAYDVIHARFGPNGLKAVFLRESGLLSGRLLTTFHGYDVNTYPRYYGRGVYRHLFRKGDLFAANTRFTRSRAIALGCPPERIHVLPAGVHADRYAFAERMVRPDQPVRLLTVGNLVEVKGVEYGLRALARLAPQRPQLRYDVVGDGPLRQPLERLAEDLGVRDRVRFRGGLPLDLLQAAYADAHLFVLPGVIARNGAQEGQGRVLLEAQAAGLPVVASRVGGIPETIAEGESGFLVPTRDVDALADRLSDLLAHPETWPALGRAGRKLVEDRFDQGRLTDALVRLYRGEPPVVES